MQEQLKKALEFANYKQTFSTQRKMLKEKAEANLTFGFAGGIFKINRELLTFVQMLCDEGRITGVVLLDIHDNPILVENLESFKDEIFDRYFTTTHEYYAHYQTLKKSRSVEKILEA